MRQALANRIVQFSKRQEQRNLSPDEIEEIINTMHSSKWKLGQTWRQHEQQCEVQGIRKARRRQAREASYQSEFLHGKDATIQYFQDGTIDVGVYDAPQAPESPKLTRMQIRYAIKHVKRTGALPALMNKQLKALGRSPSQIHNLCQQIVTVCQNNNDGQ